MTTDRPIRRGDGYLEARTTASGEPRYVARWHDGSRWRSRTFRDEDAAYDHLRSIGKRKRSGRYEPETDMTVAELVDDYIDRGRHRWSSNTVATYRLLAKQQIGPHLGSVRIVSLTPAAVQRWIDRLTGTLSPAVIENARTVLSGACREAVQLGALIANPVTGTRAPARKRVQHTTWSDAEIAAILKATVSDTRLTAMYLVALTTGIRPGELRSLKWADIDLGRGILSITRTMTRTEEYKHIVGENTKTRRMRSIALPAVTVEALTRYRADQRIRKIAAEHWVERDLVFDRGDGAPIAQQTFDNWHVKTCEAAAVPFITPHEMRHTFATRALDAGVSPKVVADILGHSSVTTTLDIYSHVSVDLQRSAIDSLAEAVTVREQSQ